MLLLMNVILLAFYNIATVTQMVQTFLPVGNHYQYAPLSIAIFYTHCVLYTNTATTALSYHIMLCSSDWWVVVSNIVWTKATTLSALMCARIMLCAQLHGLWYTDMALWKGLHDLGIHTPQGMSTLLIWQWHALQVTWLLYTPHVVFGTLGQHDGCSKSWVLS